VESRVYPLGAARQITFLLLMTMLGRRLSGVKAEQLPLLIVPDHAPDSLQSWLDSASTRQPLGNVDPHLLEDGKYYLVQHQKRNVPHLWDPASDQCEKASGKDEAGSVARVGSISALRLSRQLHHFSSQTGSARRERPEVLSVADCDILGVPGQYCRLTLLMPSIMHMVQLFLRTAAACAGPLSSIGLRDYRLVSQALTLPSVSARNYEELEFLGDVLLKMYAALQTFTDHPQYPSDLLSRARARLVNNARLQRAARAVGVDRFVTRKAFVGKEWKAGVADSEFSRTKKPSAQLSSKTLADVVESLIAAAFLDSADECPSEAKLLATLRLFLDERPWRSLSDNLAQVCAGQPPPFLQFEQAESFQSMLGYSFRDWRLLIQAITLSTSDDVGATYDRLEYLGDAILDYIVSPRLFHSPLEFTPAEMTIRHHAMVSHQLLAFFVQNVSITRSTYDIWTDPETKTTIDSAHHDDIYLPDFIRQIGSSSAIKRRQRTLTAYLQHRRTIVEGLYSDRKFPWAELSSLDAPKSYSDIFESILAAVYIDSNGSLAACEAVLGSLGYMKLLERFVKEPDIDPRQPVSMLAELWDNRCRHLGGGKLHLDASLVPDKHPKVGQESRMIWRGKIMLGSRVVASAEFQDAFSRQEACVRTAEKAIELLQRNEVPNFEPRDGRRSSKRHKHQKHDSDKVKGSNSESSNQD
jgi:dsRNA-specific ribonuclease